MNVAAHNQDYDRARPMLSVIVMNDHGFINGGQAKIAIESALQLKRRGHDVCFIAGVGPLDERLEPAGVECHVLGEHDILSDPNPLRAATRGTWNRDTPRRLAACVAARDPRSTVIHAHGWAKALSPSIGPALAGSPAAHVFTMHEYFLACPNGGFYHYGEQKICTRQPLGLSCLTTACDSRSSAHKAWRVARQTVLRTAGKLPHGLREIIYLAPQQRAVMAPFMSPEAHWHHLPNPVGAQPAERVPAERNAPFLFIGRLSPEKGAQVAARAARQAGVPLVVAGDGEMRNAVTEANPDATMLGWLKEEELQSWMRRARCLLFPSLWYECYPLVVADALRLGLPVLMSSDSVAASTVSDGVSGLHAPGGDVAAWADAMTALRSDDLVRRLSEGAFAAGKELMDEDRYVSRLISIYEDVLARKNGLNPVDRRMPA